jgi:hypothetical protein
MQYLVPLLMGEEERELVPIYARLCRAGQGEMAKEEDCVRARKKNRQVGSTIVKLKPLSSRFRERNPVKERLPEIKRGVLSA